MNIFSLKIRIGRLRYFVWMLCIGIGYSILQMILMNDIEVRYTGEYNFHGTVASCVLGILLLILLSTIPVCQRLHDLNISGKWSIIWILFACVRILSIFGSYELNHLIHIFTYPISLIFGAILLFARGSGEENKYGIRKRKPKQKGKKMENRTLLPIIGIIIGGCMLVSLCAGVGVVHESLDSRRIDWNELTIGILLIIFPPLMLYYLIKTKFGVKNHLEDDINNVEYEIEKAQLIKENCLLKKELDRLC